MKQISVGVYVVAALTDWYDGWFARKFGYITRWGRFLDPVADKILTSSAFISFASLGLVQTWMVVVIVARDIIITLLRSYTELKGKPVITTKLAKAKTFVQMVFIYCILFGYVLNLSLKEFTRLFQMLLNLSFIHWAMFFVTTLTLWTGIEYFYDNWKIIKELYVRTKKAPESA